MKFEWKDPREQFASGERLYVNGVHLGSYFWNSCAPKGTELKYRISTLLPGFMIKSVNFETPEQAKSALEKFTMRWFARFNTEKA